MSEGCLLSPPVLPSDNGAPQKGFRLRAKLENVGVTASYSRPHVSDHNPYSEALFRTVKYRPNYSPRGIELLEDARRWVIKITKTLKPIQSLSHPLVCPNNWIHRPQSKGVTPLLFSLQFFSQAHPRLWNIDQCPS